MHRTSSTAVGAVRTPGRHPWLPVGLAAVLLAGCGASATLPPAATAVPASIALRPSSPATVTIVSPTVGETVTGTTVHVVVSVANARVVAQTSSNIRPDEGHVHLYLDGALIYMQYSLQQDVPAPPGTHVLRAEFVASDHGPFSPRVLSKDVLFTVK